MSQPKYAKKTDTNQRQVIAGLEDCGLNVWLIGLPCDLLCYWPKRGFCLVECKGADKRERGKYQDALRNMQARHPSMPYAVIREGQSVVSALDELDIQFRVQARELLGVLSGKSTRKTESRRRG